MSRKHHLTVAGVAIALIAPLGGCGTGGALAGFTPMYGANGTLGPSLSRIEVASVPGRAGYLLRESLDDNLSKARGEAPLYRLAMSVKEVRIPRGLRIDNVANRYELQLRVSYALVDIRQNKTLTRGSAISIVTYDSADQPYAAVAAHQDAQERAAAEAAQRLRLNLAAYFADPKAYSAEAQIARINASSVNGRMAAQEVVAPSDMVEPEQDADLARDAPAAGAPQQDQPILLPSR